ncbi:flagellar basal body-associated FliL family protein [Sphingosinicella sp. LHD-64]|uniref:flagellar basal body-associated FliL family protein n=1 Tax=Sphingosinicella sp. LHD-64 TaxID=3072139 RepID=UPI00280C711E|nr:flagellar basal body-associated FliL family protein [Sphingosinicella sp. LHD-64]MDQ8757162.1 flagellar basal body-associated FliL family protein [Sphingosinicella sp. LHD-64]
MSDTTNTADEAPKKKSGKLKKILVILVLLIVVGGGGAAGGLYAMTGSVFGGGGHAEDEDANQPQLVVREGVSGSAAEEAKARARAPNASPDPRVFQATYVPLEGSFTSNLRGGDSFVQIGLGVSTYYGEPLTERIRTHDMAIRSAVLMALSEQDPVFITTTEGKQQLKQELKNAINNVLTNREGFGGIDDVYFTSFVTQ